MTCSQTARRRRLPVFHLASVSLALALALVGACTFQDEHQGELSSAALEESDVPAPEYYPEDDRVGNVAMGVERTLDDFASSAASRRSDAEARLSPEVWRAAVVDKVTPETVVLIARLSEDLGGKYGPDTHTARVEVVELVAGADVAAGPIEVVQTGEERAPYTCGGLVWPPDRNVALVLYPSEFDGAYRVVMDFNEAAFGWALEEAPGSFRSPLGGLLSKDDLDVVDGGAL